ncbi:MAG: hypothetical protein K2Y05_12280 [Hyphomicrobiaceae bacterium]|nr:hypothetical protein [Hyphomicrobiaceae bacterium]
MRTTLDIDADVLAAAKDLARAGGKSMGHVISDLVRRGLATPSAGMGGGFAEGQTGYAAPDLGEALFPAFPRTGGPPVTTELIERLEDEIAREGATPYDFNTGQPRVFNNR